MFWLNDLGGQIEKRKGPKFFISFLSRGIGFQPHSISSVRPSFRRNVWCYLWIIRICMEEGP